jgi:hypothetical protein
MRILSLLLILFVTCGTNLPAQNKAKSQEVFNAPNGKPFPVHWGQPPQRETRDLNILPGGYGQGSGTLARWIQGNLKTDAKDPNKAKPKKVFKAPGGKPFPAHWGQPPLRQTRDRRTLPGGYGEGSGTLVRWIQENLDKDAKDPGRVAKNTANPEIQKLEKEIAEMKRTLTVAKFSKKGLAKFITRLKQKQTKLAELKSPGKGKGKDKTPSFDEWVKGGKKIPEGLIFTGGSPWFNESTGKNRSPEQVYRMIFNKDPKK